MKKRNNAMSGLASRRSVCTAILLAAVVPATAFAHAANYPNKPILLVVAIAPGGGSDVAGRFTATGLSQRLGQQVAVDNKPGAAGIVGSDIAAKSPADGYTLLIGHVGTLTMNSSLYEKVPYEVSKAFEPLGVIYSTPLIGVTAPAAGITSLASLVAKAKAAPGTVNYSTSGAGTSAHITSEMLSGATQVKLTQIPYKGAAPALAAVLAGEVSYTFTSPVLAPPLIKAGRLVPLAVTGGKRNSQFPDVPMIAEGGILGVEFGDWYAVVAPAETPKPILKNKDDSTGILHLVCSDLTLRFVASYSSTHRASRTAYAQLQLFGAAA